MLLLLTKRWRAESETWKTPVLAMFYRVTSRTHSMRLTSANFKFLKRSAGPVLKRRANPARIQPSIGRYEFATGKRWGQGMKSSRAPRSHRSVDAKVRDVTKVHPVRP